MLGAITIGELAEAKEIIKRLSHGADDGCAVLERMIMIDFYVLCGLLLPENTLKLDWKQVSRKAVLQIPLEIIEALAILSDEQRRKLAHKWSQSEEFIDSIEEEDVNDFLAESVQFAKKSLAENKSLLFINI